MINLSTLPLPTAEEAARFLGHASLGYTLAEVNDLKTRGYKAWFDTQFALYDQQRINPNAKYLSNFDWLKAKLPPVQQGTAAITNEFWPAQIMQSVLRRHVQGGDLLVQRVTFALSQIVVVSGKADLAVSFPQYLLAAYLDMLQKHSLGSYRALLSDVSRHPAMSRFLTFLGSRKEDAARSPDENYARELMQLFTVGVAQLNADGTPVLDGENNTLDTYTTTMVRELAPIFTGWMDAPGTHLDVERFRKHSINNPGDYETRDLTLELEGQSPEVISGTDPVARLEQALDYLFAHPNVAPFISRQLIQRLVTSNPSAAYVQRVADEFRVSGGDLKRVVQAILMDESLFDASLRRRGGLGEKNFGKVREPWCRLIHWGRAFGATSRSGAWTVGYDTVSVELPTQLGQAPMMAPSVFNFFRPGYIPPSSVTSKSTDADGHRLVAPELQITDEVSTVSYINFMTTAINPATGVSGVADVASTYAAWVTKASNPTVLLDDLSLVLTAGRLKGFPTATVSANYTRIKNAISTMPISTAAQRAQRVQAAILLVMASPEYIVQQ